MLINEARVPYAKIWEDRLDKDQGSIYAIQDIEHAMLDGYHVITPVVFQELNYHTLNLEFTQRVKAVTNELN